MPVPHPEILLPPRCELCGGATTRIGKLPRIGLRPLVYVYKCGSCNRVTSVEPERQSRDRTVARPRSARQPKQGGSRNA
ncbi:MAG: hypothetical protein PS018_01705 [bacterium]|nr:hypothetical protein [bacterium]